jgi:hypothetical protein
MNGFRRRYQEGFEAHLRDPGSEDALHAAYELGREAVQNNLSLLDLAIAHHAALMSALHAEVLGSHPERTIRAAEDFFLESVSAFEIMQRGFRETHDIALLQRRHAEMLRHLSTFLADASLTLSAAPDSVGEILRLVAEQARELVAADCCVVIAEADGHPRVRAASYPENGLDWKTFVAWTDLSQLDDLVRAATAENCPSAEADRLAQLVGLTRGEPAKTTLLRDWLGVAMHALDGRRIGSIHLFNRIGGQFSSLDHAVALHLAQMAAAAVERLQLHTPPRQRRESSGN